MKTDFSNYKCDQCGACCSLIVEAGILDVMREPKLLELYKGDDVADLRSGQKVVMLYDFKTHTCPFLRPDTVHEKKTVCTIYPTRPNCCVGVEAGDAKCQQARLIQSLPLLKDIDGNDIDGDLLEASCEEYGLTLEDIGLQ